MPADVMASTKDEVIEPKSVLQIFRYSAQRCRSSRDINQRQYTVSDWFEIISCNMFQSLHFCSDLDIQEYEHMKLYKTTITCQVERREMGRGQIGGLC